jgi:hypothetical protein
MNRQQRKRKIRDRSKKFIGVVSSIKAEPMITQEMLNYMFVTADEIGLRTISKVVYDAMEVMRAKNELKRAQDTAEHCQSLLADARVKIVQLEQALYGKAAARIMVRKRGSSPSPFHPMSGRKNRNRHYAR